MHYNQHKYSHNSMSLTRTYSKNTAVHCNLMLFLLNFTATYWIFLSTKSLINNTSHYSTSRKPLPKNNENISALADLLSNSTLLRVRNSHHTNNTECTQKCTKITTGMHQLCHNNYMYLIVAIATARWKLLTDYFSPEINNLGPVYKGDFVPGWLSSQCLVIYL